MLCCVPPLLMTSPAATVFPAPTVVAPAKYCLPRHSMQFDYNKRGFEMRVDNMADNEPGE